MIRYILLIITILLCSPAPQAQDTRAFYLSRFTGDGSSATPFRPAGLDQVGAGCIDLRKDPTVVTGFALCAAPLLPGDAGVISLSSSLTANIPAGIKIAIQTALGVTIQSGTIDTFIPELLIQLGKEDGTRWKSLKATSQGIYEIYLGQRIYRQTAFLYPYLEDGGMVADAVELLEPAVAWAASVSENWNCTAAASITCQLTWNEYDGTGWDIPGTNDRITATGTTRAGALETSDIGSSNQQVQATLLNFVRGAASYIQCYVTSRQDNAGTRTFYLWNAYKDGSTNEYQLSKRVAAAQTVLTTNAQDPANNDVMKIQVNGSSVTGYVSGVLLAGPVTDTSVSSGNYSGVVFDGNSAGATCSLDDFSANDITSFVPRRRF